MKKVYAFEPYCFMFFGVFHLHRIWGLIDRASYAEFWIQVMEQKGLFYFGLMGVLAILCIAGIVTFFMSIHHNFWWRYVYLFGGGYVLFDLMAIATGLKFWRALLLALFDVNSPYWVPVWGGFILLGLFSFVHGCALLRKRRVDADQSGFHGGGK